MYSCVVGLTSLSPRKHLIDNWPNLSRTEQASDLAQLLAARFDNEPGEAHPVSRCLFRLWWADDGDQETDLPMDANRFHPVVLLLLCAR